MTTFDKVVNTVTALSIRLIQQIAAFFLSIIYRGPNELLAPIHEKCLLGSARALAAKIRGRKITSSEVVKACMKRIKDINGTLNSAVDNRFDAALKEAEQIDTFLAQGSKSAEEIEKATPFLGVPFTVKDGIAVKGLIYSAGVVKRKHVVAAEDAEAVALLRQAGAIPIAITNIPELMAWWDTNCKLHGRTNNPYHTKYMAGGSSGGEASLIAAGGSLMGLGSDVGGSIRVPSSMCGVFGHKPSPDIVSDIGQYTRELAEEKIGVLGPISKFSEDLRPMLKVLSKGSKINLRLDDKVDIKELRYFYMEEYPSTKHSLVGSAAPQVKQAMQSVVDYFLNTHGITVVKVNMTQMKNVMDMWWAKMTDETGSLFVPKEKGKNLLLELIKVLFGKSEHTFEVILVAFLQQLQPAFGSAKHKHFLEQGRKLTDEFQSILRDDGIFFFPTFPTPPMKHCQNNFHYHNFSHTTVFNVTRMPVTQCPIMLTEDNLPIGIQVAAARNQDRLTLAVAEELEKAFGGWKPPPSQPKITKRTKP